MLRHGRLEGLYSMEGNILLVEDDEEIALIVREHMQRSGYKVIWASTGKEAIEEFRKQDFDLILLDLMLPEMDGFSVCKNIRLTSEVPIVITSAREGDFDKVKGLKLGADDYVTKPFSLIELEARVETNIRRYKKFKGLAVDGDENLLKYKGGLCIDKANKKVTIDDRIIDLTSKEYSILVLLAENPNRTFNKTEIYENIWGQADIDGNNTVTMHIKKLRLKLSEDTRKPLFLQTSWGIGYRFIGEKQ
jgi:two-component system OmpR family response regulator